MPTEKLKEILDEVQSGERRAEYNEKLQRLLSKGPFFQITRK